MSSSSQRRRRRRSKKASNELDRIELRLTREALRLAKKRKPFYRI